MCFLLLLIMYAMASQVHLEKRLDLIWFVLVRFVVPVVLSVNQGG